MMPNDSSNSPVWFITGCSTGLGRALAERVLQQGERCVATARNPAQLEGLAGAYPRTALTLALDVTNGAQIETAVTKANETFGAIDVLVNNAGRGYSAAIEEGDDGEVRAMFDTNFFGLIALTQRVLPEMRARRRGHIVNLSSIGGLVASASAGYYNASKFAIEGLSQALRVEVAPLGIHVTVVEPGPFRTDFQGRSLTITKTPLDAYAATAGAKRAQFTASSGKQAGDPVRAADAIIKAVRSPQPPLHLLLGKNALDRARAVYAEFLQSMDEWEEVTLSADFPESLRGEQKA